MPSPLAVSWDSYTLHNTPTHATLWRVEVLNAFAPDLVLVQGQIPPQTKTMRHRESRRRVADLAIYDREIRVKHRDKTQNSLYPTVQTNIGSLKKKFQKMNLLKTRRILTIEERTVRKFLQQNIFAPICSTIAHIAAVLEVPKAFQAHLQQIEDLSEDPLVGRAIAIAICIPASHFAITKISHHGDILFTGLRWALSSRARSDSGPQRARSDSGPQRSHKGPHESHSGPQRSHSGPQRARSDSGPHRARLPIGHPAHPQLPTPPLHLATKILILQHPEFLAGPHRRQSGARLGYQTSAVRVTLYEHKNLSRTPLPHTTPSTYIPDLTCDGDIEANPGPNASNEITRLPGVPLSQLWAFLSRNALRHVPLPHLLSHGLLHFTCSTISYNVKDSTPSSISLIRSPGYGPSLPHMPPQAISPGLLPGPWVTSNAPMTTAWSKNFFAQGWCQAPPPPGSVASSPLYNPYIPSPSCLDPSLQRGGASPTAAPAWKSSLHNRAFSFPSKPSWTPTPPTRTVLPFSSLSSFPSPLDLVSGKAAASAPRPFPHRTPSTTSSSQAPKSDPSTPIARPPEQLPQKPNTLPTHPQKTFVPSNAYLRLFLWNLAGRIARQPMPHHIPRHHIYHRLR